MSRTLGKFMIESNASSNRIYEDFKDGEECTVYLKDRS